MEKYDEEILTDDYRVYYDYCYVVAGRVVRSDIQGTISDLRQNLQEKGINAEVIRSCDLVGRGIRF